jgi:hypothetical protein
LMVSGKWGSNPKRAQKRGASMQYVEKGLHERCEAHERWFEMSVGLRWAMDWECAAERWNKAAKNRELKGKMLLKPFMKFKNNCHTSCDHKMLKGLT